LVRYSDVHPNYYVVWKPHLYLGMCIYILYIAAYYIYIYTHMHNTYIPVPHKAVAEVSKIGNL
jgi:hypothetical protein